MANELLENGKGYAALHCLGDSVADQRPCGEVKISYPEYLGQLNKADDPWTCPNCGSTAEFDDEYFEQVHGD